MSVAGRRAAGCCHNKAGNELPLSCQELGSPCAVAQSQAHLKRVAQQVVLVADRLRRGRVGPLLLQVEPLLAGLVVDGVQAVPTVVTWHMSCQPSCSFEVN